MLELPEIISCQFLQGPALILGFGGRGEGLDYGFEFRLSEEGGVGEVEMGLLDAVVAPRCFPVVAVLRHAELGDFFAVLAPHIIVI